MEEAKDISLGVSFPIKRMKDINRAPILVLCHSVVPLFYLSIKGESSVLEGLSSSWMLRLTTFGVNKDCTFFAQMSHESLNRKMLSNEPVENLLQLFIKKSEFRDYLEKHNLQFKHLNLKGYIDKVQVLRDVFIFMDQIPKI